MANVKTFVKHPKIDAHNHLNLGMRYSRYASWAGFLIPNFPRKMSGLAEMHEVIGQYTRTRTVTAKDVEDLLCMSIEDAIEDGITILEGSVDIGFVKHCNEDIDQFLALVEKVKKKYEGKIDFRPELGLGKLFDKKSLNKWVIPLLESKVFKSIDLYGPEVEEGIEDFKPFFECAGKLGIKRKAHVGEFSDATSVRTFINFFDLEEVQHGIGAANDDKVIQFMLDRKIRLNITPESNVMLSAVPSLQDHPIKKFYDAGLKVTICTDDLLFFNRTVSEQCSDLVKAGVFTEKEIFDILDEGLK
ncbi:MAG: adenosine deaminase [Treponema sp.]|jgi:adenosine deaminase|nr:adenosine deaminase [Treponema sp.]